MAQKQCEHCAAFNTSINDNSQTLTPLSKQTEYGSPLDPLDGDDSDKPPDFGEHQSIGNRDGNETQNDDLVEESGESAKDEEKGEDSNAPTPVGFWDSSLSRLRLEVFGLWARTGRLVFSFTCK